MLKVHAGDVAGGSTPGCPAVEWAGGQGVTSDGVRVGGEAPEEVLRPVESGKKLLLIHLCRCFLQAR